MRLHGVVLTKSTGTTLLFTFTVRTSMNEVRNNQLYFRYSDFKGMSLSLYPTLFMLVM